MATGTGLVAQGRGETLDTPLASEVRVTGRVECHGDCPPLLLHPLGSTDLGPTAFMAQRLWGPQQRPAGPWASGESSVNVEAARFWAPFEEAVQEA